MKFLCKLGVHDYETVGGDGICIRVCVNCGRTETNIYHNSMWSLPGTKWMTLEKAAAYRKEQTKRKQLAYDVLEELRK